MKHGASMSQSISYMAVTLIFLVFRVVSPTTACHDGDEKMILVRGSRLCRNYNLDHVLRILDGHEHSLKRICAPSLEPLN